jgi:hypothetical protein
MRDLPAGRGKRYGALAEPYRRDLKPGSIYRALDGR